VRLGGKRKSRSGTPGLRPPDLLFLRASGGHRRLSRGHGHSPRHARLHAAPVHGGPRLTRPGNTSRRRLADFHHRHRQRAAEDAAVASTPNRRNIMSKTLIISAPSGRWRISAASTTGPFRTEAEATGAALDGDGADVVAEFEVYREADGWFYRTRDR